LVATRARNHFIIFLLSGSGRRRLSFLPPTRRNAPDPIGWGRTRCVQAQTAAVDQAAAVFQLTPPPM
jgi:hypothetical protein